MTIFISIVFGLVLGGGVGWFWGRRAERAAILFSATDPEDEQLLEARAAITERTSKRLDRIMATATKEGRITNDGVEELFCISDRTASTYLRTLTEQGRLERQGVGRGTFYTPR